VCAEQIRATAKRAPGFAGLAFRQGCGKEPGKARNSWEKETLHGAWGVSTPRAAARACPRAEVAALSFKARGLRGEVGDGSFPQGLVLGDGLSRRLVTPAALAGTPSQPPGRRWRESGARFWCARKNTFPLRWNAKVLKHGHALAAPATAASALVLRTGLLTPPVLSRACALSLYVHIQIELKIDNATQPLSRGDRAPAGSPQLGAASLPSGDFQRNLALTLIKILGCSSQIKAYNNLED